MAPHTSAVMAELFPRYLDRRAVRLVEGAVEETTQLLTYPWDHVFYTDNGAVGRIVMEAAAKHLAPVTLELGGKSPVFIDGTADIDAVASWLAWGKFLNSGQTCVAPDYVLAPPEVAAALVPALKAAVEKLYGAVPPTGAGGDEDRCRRVDTVESDHAVEHRVEVGEGLSILLITGRTGRPDGGRSAGSPRSALERPGSRR